MSEATVTTVTVVDAFVENVTFTPYAACKVVNAFLAEAGVAKVLPPQMFYTYVGKGFIPAGTDKRIKSDDLLEWMLAYTAKQVAKNA